MWALRTNGIRRQRKGIGRGAMFIKRWIGRYLARLIVLGAISAGTKALKDLKGGGGAKKKVLKVVGKR
jgi:hypothetical protein